MGKNIFLGKWRICEMEEWDQDFIDAEIPGFISFSKNGRGKFHFGYVSGSMDCYYSKRDGNEAVEFSWEGNDEMDPVFGRGFVIMKEKELTGHLFFHEGENSGFKAVRQE